MKRIYTYLLMIACATIFVGCQKDFDGILNAEIEGYNDTDGKVYINDKYACWNDGDLVWVNGEKCRVNITNSSATIQTNINSEPADGYTAIFPAQYAVEKNKYQLPQTQIYRTVQVGSQHLQKVDAPMVAYTKGTSDDQNHPTMVFKNAGALINVKVKNTTNKTITLRYIELIGNTSLWGTVTYAQAINDVPSMSSIENTETNNNIITLAFDQEPIVLNSQDEKTFYVVVPTVTTTIQPKVYYTTDGTNNTLNYYISASVSVSDEKNINRSKISTMDLTSNEIFNFSNDNVTQFGDGTPLNPFQIYTYNEFKSIPNSSSNCYKQMANIERPVDESGNHEAGPSRFMGTYDGNNHSIKITASTTCAKHRGVFTTLSYNAVVKNLIVNADIKACKNSKISYTGGIASNLAGDNNNEMNVTIENCTINGTIDGKREVGGLIGKMFERTHLTIKNCTNNANLNGYFIYKEDGKLSTSYVGGMIGHVSSNIKFINCTNTGTLQGRHTHYLYNHESLSSTTIESQNCSNSGSVTNVNGPFSPDYWN